MDSKKVYLISDMITELLYLRRNVMEIGKEFRNDKEVTQLLDGVIDIINQLHDKIAILTLEDRKVEQVLDDSTWLTFTLMEHADYIGDDNMLELLWEMYEKFKAIKELIKKRCEDNAGK